MSFKKTFTLAISSVMNNKMRSFLTMLGIIIGVAAVIVLVSVMDGLTGQITGIFEDMGTNTITINLKHRAALKISSDDIYAMRDKNPELIGSLSPSVGFTVTVKSGTDSVQSSITGVSEEYENARNVKIEQGRFIKYIESDRMQKVCVVGTFIEKEFFDGKSAVGETIKINGYPYTIIGVLEESADSTESSNDNCIYIPYKNATKMLGSSNIYSYVLTNVDEDSLDATMSLIKSTLNKILGGDDYGDDYYTVTSMKQLLDQFGTIMNSMKTALVCIAGISLLVGGIGIMNIMLVSVTERTREIGIRKSLGAKRKDIMRQFVIEAGTVSSVGGIIGIILGAVCAYLFGNLLNLTVVPSAGAVALAFGVSVGIGIVFGFLPAGKASKLNPIDALRYD